MMLPCVLGLDNEYMKARGTVQSRRNLLDGTLRLVFEKENTVTGRIVSFRLLCPVSD